MVVGDARGCGDPVSAVAAYGLVEGLWVRRDQRKLMATIWWPSILGTTNCTRLPFWQKSSGSCSGTQATLLTASGTLTETLRL